MGPQPRHARRLARVVAEPRRPPLLLHGQGQHRLPLGHLAGDAARLRRRRRAGAGRARPPAAVQRRRERVPDRRGRAVLARAAAHVIYVGDFLDRYDPDPLRYYLTAAGPETQDTDFTWAEFVRRNNDELLANWGNLVNRTLVNAHRHFGAVPRAGRADRADRAAPRGGRGRVRHESAALIEHGRFRAALAEAMRLSAASRTSTSPTQAPWKLVEDGPRPRRARCSTSRSRASTI